jgi:hypothetical protein
MAITFHRLPSFNTRIILSATADDSGSDLVVPETLREELAMLFSPYEHCVKTSIPFPYAKQPNTVVKNLYNEIMVSYGMFSHYSLDAVIHPAPPEPVRPESTASRRMTFRKTRSTVPPPPPPAEEPVSSWKLLLETMYRASRHTFGWRTVQRYIGMVAVLLESHEEASHMLRVYLDKDRKESRHGEWWKRKTDEMGGEARDDVLMVMLAYTHVCLQLRQVRSFESGVYFSFRHRVHW